MVFSSLLFLTVFLPVFLLIYFLLPRKRGIKHAFLLLASFVFYMWGEPRFVFLIFFTTIVDFYLVRAMDRQEKQRSRKLLLAASVSLNLGLLCYFKYAVFLWRM